MSVSFNKVIIAGNLAKDVELRYTNKSQKPVANMVVAVNDYYSQDVNYFKVIAWNKIAENCDEYLEKGRGVLVEGKLQRRSYEKDNETKYVTEIVANNIQFLSSNSNTEKKSQKNTKKSKTQKKQAKNTPQENYKEDDDIPF